MVITVKCKHDKFKAPVTSFLYTQWLLPLLELLQYYRGCGISTLPPTQNPINLAPSIPFVFDTSLFNSFINCFLFNSSIFFFVSSVCCCSIDATASEPVNNFISKRRENTLSYELSNEKSVWVPP